MEIIAILLVVFAVVCFLIETHDDGKPWDWPNHDQRHQWKE